MKTIIVLLVLAFIIFSVIYSMIKNKKNGGGGCGCGCKGCAMSDSCHNK